MRCRDGHENADGQRFCGTCGERLSFETVEASQSNVELEATKTESTDDWWQTPRRSSVHQTRANSENPGMPIGPTAPGAVKVKKYPNTAAANRDARRMAQQGWEPQGMAGGGTRRSLGKGIVNKGMASAVLGPLGLFASSRVEQPVIITWIRTPEAAAADERRRHNAAEEAARRQARAAAARAEKTKLREEAKTREAASKRESAEARQAKKLELERARQEAKEEKSLAKSKARADRAQSREAAKEAKALATTSKHAALVQTTSNGVATTLEQQHALTRRPSSGDPGQQPNPPPAWHPDPSGQARLRWWDGTKWTGHISS